MPSSFRRCVSQTARSGVSATSLPSAKGLPAIASATTRMRLFLTRKAAMHLLDRLTDSSVLTAITAAIPQRGRAKGFPDRQARSPPCLSDSPPAESNEDRGLEPAQGQPRPAKLPPAHATAREFAPGRRTYQTRDAARQASWKPAAPYLTRQSRVEVAGGSALW